MPLSLAECIQALGTGSTTKGGLVIRARSQILYRPSTNTALPRNMEKR